MRSGSPEPDDLSRPRTAGPPGPGCVRVARPAAGPREQSSEIERSSKFSTHTHALPPRRGLSFCPHHPQSPPTGARALAVLTLSKITTLGCVAARSAPSHYNVQCVARCGRRWTAHPQARSPRWAADGLIRPQAWPSTVGGAPYAMRIERVTRLEVPKTAELLAALTGSIDGAYTGPGEFVPPWWLVISTGTLPWKQ